ncbi:hypothetical protein [Aliivibrio wodanis]|uniref:hypothetical protein n=1 Tax=Aliivibrio wodanis TaxID=80852 RepID=UPI00406C03E0
MANNDLRLQQRAKLLAKGGQKPKVTLSQEQSLAASKLSIQLVSQRYTEEQMQLVS